MTDITIIQDAPTYKELADIAGELAARVQELEAACGEFCRVMNVIQTAPQCEALWYQLPQDLLEARWQAHRAISGEGRP